MTQEAFLKRLHELHTHSLNIARNKNTDYAGGDDAFKNFTNVTNYGISTEQGILVRMSDKITRISNLLTKQAKVKDETVLDTLTDLSNYALILRIYLESKIELSNVSTGGAAIPDRNVGVDFTPPRERTQGAGTDEDIE
jgi:hypothetical protein